MTLVYSIQCPINIAKESAIANWKDVSIFSNLTKLKALFLNGNHLTTLPEIIFKGRTFSIFALIEKIVAYDEI